jgi:hypothetical protein
VDCRLQLVVVQLVVVQLVLLVFELLVLLYKREYNKQ